jgi:hypothetical protein
MHACLAVCTDLPSVPNQIRSILMRKVAEFLLAFACSQLCVPGLAEINCYWELIAVFLCVPCVPLAKSLSASTVPVVAVEAILFWLYLVTTAALVFQLLEPKHEPVEHAYASGTCTVHLHLTFVCNLGTELIVYIVTNSRDMRRGRIKTDMAFTVQVPGLVTLEARALHRRVDTDAESKLI